MSTLDEIETTVADPILMLALAAELDGLPHSEKVHQNCAFVLRKYIESGVNGYPAQQATWHARYLLRKAGREV